MQYQAAYILEALYQKINASESEANASVAETEKVEALYQKINASELKLLKQLSYFEVESSFENESPILDKIHPIFPVTNNIICRGLPTKMSVDLEEMFAQTFGETQSETEYGTISFPFIKTDNDQIYKDIINIIKLQLILNPENYKENYENNTFSEDNLDTLQMALSPFAIARVQKTIIEAILRGVLNTANTEWKICIIERDVPCAHLAVADLQRMFEHLFALAGNENPPQITLTVASTPEFASAKLNKGKTVHQIDNLTNTADYDLLIDVAILERAGLVDRNDFHRPDHYAIIRSANDTCSTRKFYTSDVITYQAITTQQETGKHDINTELLPHLTYFLQAIFRKKEFRSGQIEIISRALQRKSVIGLLPTGGGKSLTYQLSALLQAALTIIIDPINSLMRDQYEKLIENYIDAALYINSYNSKEERIVNEEKLQNAEAIFCFVSPERFQIQKFRDVLKKCKDNNTYFSYAIIDEAHCVSEWGHDFRQTYLRLGDNLKAHCPVKTAELTLIGLTATASYDVLADIQRELKLENDAVQSMPAEQIDRKELVFNLIKVEDTGIEQPTWKREKKLGIKKYPIIKELLKQLPQKLNKIITNLLANDKISDEYKKNLRDKLPELNKTNFYGKNDKGKYPHSGIIFCPTKSDTLGNGVLALRDGYDGIPGLKRLVFLENKTNFYGKNEKDKYPHSGIIFCPTKSDTLGNGVLALRDGYNGIPVLKRLIFLEIATFFSSQDEDLAANNLVDKEAELSFDNQGKFIQNKVNLMLATKAFGMGIDKPNIRYTIHYSLPSSVESFYQEAGRAGRDGLPALSSIVYCSEDERTNLDFLRNAFKGIEREKALLTELLEEVEYEDEFFLNYLASLLNEEFKMNFKLIIWREQRLYINEKKPWIDGRPDPTEKAFGYIRIKTLKSHPLEVENARQIIDFVKFNIEKLCPSQDYLGWLKQTQTPGLETLLDKENAENCLLIGFSNKKITEIKDLIIKEEVIENIIITSIGKDGKTYTEDATERFIRAAYNFCWDAENFVNDKLPYEYKRQVRNAIRMEQLHGTFSNEMHIPEELKPLLKELFYKIRITPDTQKAIYRLIILGVIDDYTIDYAGKAIVVYFSKKTEKEYETNFCEYLKRYVGEDTKNQWLNKAKEKYKDESPLRRYLFALAEFVDEIIHQKRGKAISYVKDLCETSIKQEDTNTHFREDISLYFTSKFAKLSGEGSLNEDTDGGKKEDFSTVEKYIEYIWTAPDGIGDQISNTKHLKAACARMKTSTTAGFDNATIDLLHAFSTLAIEVQTNITNLQEIQVAEAANWYRKGFEKFESKYSFSEWVDSTIFFNEKLAAINPIIIPLLQNWQQELVIKHQKNWLSQFNNNFIDISI